MVYVGQEGGVGGVGLSIKLEGCVQVRGVQLSGSVGEIGGMSEEYVSIWMDTEL